MRSILLALALGAMVWITAPLWRQYPEQDDCTFGPVSNAEYRGILARAKGKFRATWWPSDDIAKIASTELRDALSEIAGNEPSLYKRLASIHAIARAAGAHLLNFNEGAAWPAYESGPDGRHLISLNYQTDVIRFIRLQIYPRRVWINAGVWDPASTQEDKPIIRPGLSIGAHSLSVFDLPHESFLFDQGLNCPPVPSADVATRYETRQR